MTRRQDNRDALLEASAGSAVELLRYHDLDRSLPCILEKLGTATGADRMQLMQYETTPAGAFRVAGHHGWCAPGIERSILDGWVEGQTMEENGFRPWGDRLCRGEIIAGPAESFEPPIRAFLERDGVRSVSIVPVFVKGQWWGAIGFDDCTRTRTWSSAEIDALRTLAELVGTAVQQARDVARLKDAHRIIGNSPTILFRLGGEHPYPLRYVSPNIERYGYTPAQLLAAPQRWPNLVDSADLPALMRAIRSIAHDGAGEAEAEFRFIMPDGARVWFDGHATPFRDGEEGAQAIEGLITDVTERKESARKIERLARTDSLTGLLNRGAFQEQLAAVCARAGKRDAAFFAVHFIDLDGFKSVNDALGHPAGDELLKAVAGRLARNVRGTDTVARFGGDEFAVLQRELPSADAAERMAGQIRAAVARPYKVAGHRVELTASIGVDCVTGGRARPGDVMARADLALYAAKDDGRNGVRLYEPGLEPPARSLPAGALRPLPAA